MHLDRFDLNLLVALDALLNEKHVTRAAEKLCISQPAMSAALSRLRAYFDDPLLEKVGSRLELTPRADDLAGEVSELISRMRSVLRSETTFDPLTDRREVHLLMSDYTATVLMPALVRSLAVKAPNTRCIVEHLGPDSFTKVNRGIADFAIAVEERELLESNSAADLLSGETLFEDDFVIVIDHANPAARMPITLEVFLTLPFVEVRFADAVFSLIETAIRRQKLPVRVAAVLPSFIEAACMIPGTSWATILPRRLATLVATRFNLIVQNLPIGVPPVRESVVWHPRNDKSPAHNWFRSQLRETAADLTCKG